MRGTLLTATVLAGLACGGVVPDLRLVTEVGRDHDRKLAMGIDGEQVLGRVKAGPCTGDPRL